MSSHEEKLARLEVEVEYIKKHLDAQALDVKEIKRILSEASGGWKALAIVGGISATIGGLLVKFGWAALFN